MWACAVKILQRRKKLGQRDSALTITKCDQIISVPCGPRLRLKEWTLVLTAAVTNLSM